MKNSLLQHPKHYWKFEKNCKNVNILPSLLELNDLHSDIMNSVTDVFACFCLFE